MSEIILNDEQNRVLDIMIGGNNVFLTGAAGTGKSEIIKHFKRYCLTHNKYTGITSTTGVSAYVIGGQTLHSYLGIGIGKGDIKTIFEKIINKGKIDVWKSLDVLIIDEISMLTPELFDKLEQIARSIRNCDKPFGGIQIIASGDFCQLPPINSDYQCFDAESWLECFPYVFYLRKIMRQEDRVFQETLSKIRVGIIDDEVKKVLNKRIGADIIMPKLIKPTRLYPFKKNVREHNRIMLIQLKNKLKKIDSLKNHKISHIYSRKFTFIENTNTKSEITAPNLEYYEKKFEDYVSVEFTIGCQVMLTYNVDVTGGLTNGSRGVILRFEKKDNGFLPVVRWMNNRETLVRIITGNFKAKDGNIHYSYLPLLPAYAISIHKSQAVSLDCVEMDLKELFSYGQGYVALSRVRTLDGLKILNIDYETIKADPRCVEFYSKIK